MRSGNEIDAPVQTACNRRALLRFGERKLQLRRKGGGDAQQFAPPQRRQRVGAELRQMMTFLKKKKQEAGVPQA